jgi:murein DD-endopeptidase
MPVTSPSSISRRFRLALLGLPLATGLLAQARPAIVQSVDLLVPIAPAVVPIGGKTQVAYELHITNFLSVDVSLSRLLVRRGDRPNVAMADYRGEELGKRIGRPGLRRGVENPHVVGAGMRAVVYLWIEAADGSDVPASLTHRVELDVLRQSGPVRAEVEGAASNVSRESPVVLSPPVRGGPWTAIYDPMMMGGHRTAIYTVDGRARIPARFAVDWIRVPPEGVIAPDPAPRPADWNGRGAEVLAVADAVVAAAGDDIPDNPDVPPDGAPPVPLENASGNYVTLDIGRGRFAFYEHLQRGSVLVKAGDRVKSGQVIGRLGNSGSSSVGPHLHFHVGNANSHLGAEGLPFVFTSFEHLGGFASIEALAAGSKWASDGRGARRLEHPAANSVIRF